MPAIAYVNGRYGPIAASHVEVEDRGLQFADSIYEVIAWFDRVPLDWAAHLWRLRRNAAALFLPGLPSDGALGAIADRLIGLSRARCGLLYIQLTRGPARRDHGFPAHPHPTLILTARRFDFARRLVQQAEGVAAITLPDQRWHRSDIKTTGLLAAVLAREEAHRGGAFEAILERDGLLTEGAATNLWLVDAAGQLHTHPLSAQILPGIARDSLVRIAAAAGMTVIEQPFTAVEAAAAPELFLTSTTAPVLPVVRLDGVPIGTGRPGPVATRLAALTWNEIQRQTGWRAPA
jgi:D-alanine transaminase